VENSVRPGMIIEGNVLPEPIRVVLVESIGRSLKIGGQGLRTKQYYERLLNPD
jgi:hypothetical protein